MASGAAQDLCLQSWLTKRPVPVSELLAFSILLPTKDSNDSSIHPSLLYVPHLTNQGLEAGAGLRYWVCAFENGEVSLVVNVFKHRQT